MTSTTFHTLNYDRPIPDLQQPFQIVCPSNTDLWDKPPSTHRATSPLIYQITDKGSFQSARVTFSADWKDKYDQGGLCLVLVFEDGTRKWVKSGVEWLDEEAHVSTVAKDQWADWSLRPTTPEGASGATVEIGVIGDGALWVYLISAAGKKLPVREVTWWGDIPASTRLWVGPYAAKPAKEDRDLVVDFKDLVINVE